MKVALTLILRARACLHSSAFVCLKSILKYAAPRRQSKYPMSNALTSKEQKQLSVRSVPSSIYLKKLCIGENAWVVWW